jgi:hypothetical protein
MSYLLEVSIPVTPGDPVAAGGHLYAENPDQSTGAGFILGVTALGEGALTGPWNPLDLGKYAYSAADQPWVVRIADAVPGAQIRLYVAPYSNQIDVPLVRAGQPGATPSVLVTVPAQTADKPGSGEEYGPCVDAIAVSLLANTSITGIMKTPVCVTITNPYGLSYELVEVWDSDPSKTEIICTGIFTLDGLVPAGPDGYSTPHTLLIDTPTTSMGFTLYARTVVVENRHAPDLRGTVDNTRDSVIYKRNTIVPSVTPHVHVIIGTTGGTVDLKAALHSSIGGGLKLMADGLHFNPGDGLGTDLDGYAIVKTGNGLGFDINGTVVPNFGATVGLDPNGKIVVPSGSLGLLNFGGAYQPYGFYYGLPSPWDTTVPKLIVNTVDWKVYRNASGVWKKEVDPADLIGGTITALVSLISPTIAGGSITGATMALSKENVTVTIDPTYDANSGWGPIKITDNVRGNYLILSPTGIYAFSPTGAILTAFGATYDEGTNTWNANVQLHSANQRYIISGGTGGSNVASLQFTDMTTSDYISITQLGIWKNGVQVI